METTKFSKSNSIERRLRKGRGEGKKGLWREGKTGRKEQKVKGGGGKSSWTRREERNITHRQGTEGKYYVGEACK